MRTMSQAFEASNSEIQLWKVKKLIKSLDSARGVGTSMISLIIPPKSQISRFSAMLNEEHGTASNIKSKVNRLSVLTAIQSAQARLKLYNRVPPNGLAIYVGTVSTQDNREKKVSIDFEPHKPLGRFLYLCDSKFHTEPLLELFETESCFGFIVMDGHGALFATLAGNARHIVHRLTVDLPKKHSRGGQSAARFGRIRDEKRHNYVRKVAELAVHYFVTNDKVNVTGLILAGSADFKTDLSQSDMFDPRLAARIIKIVDVSYGGQNGFNQAIDLASDSLENIKFMKEKRLVQKYFDEISRDTGKFCYGIDDTLKALELGAVETLIIWENLDVIRYSFCNAAGDEVIVCTHDEHASDRSMFVDRSTGLQMEQVEEPQPLFDWLAENYQRFGATLEIVTDSSQEGTQFVKGFGGIGGLLRYKLDLETLTNVHEDEFLSSEDEDF